MLPKRTLLYQDKILILFQHATDDKFAATPVGILVVGVFMLVVSSFGIWGVKRKSKCLTGLYGFALIIVIIAQLATIIAPIVAAEKSEEVLEKTGFKTLSVRNND